MPRKALRVLPPLSEQEVVRLLETNPSPRDRALILFMLDTGCRAAEVLGITGADLDLEQMTAVVQRGKGRKPRLLPLHPLTGQALAAYFALRGRPGPDEALWLTQTKATPLTYAGLRRLFAQLARPQARRLPGALRHVAAAIAATPRPGREAEGSLASVAQRPGRRAPPKRYAPLSANRPQIAATHAT